MLDEALNPKRYSCVAETKTDYEYEFDYHRHDFPDLIIIAALREIEADNEKKDL